MRSITCEADGYKATFDLTSFSKRSFILAKVDGLYSAENNLKITKNAMSDGGTFQGSTAKVRNIVLTLMSDPKYVDRQQYRDLLYRLFSKDSVGKLTYEENGVKRYTHYRVEYIKQGAYKKRIYTVSLLCEDPFFYAEESIRCEMANWISDFEFPAEMQNDELVNIGHEFIAISRPSTTISDSEGEELGHRSAVRSIEIVNSTTKEGIGLEITIKCTGAVTNPRIAKNETAEQILINTAFQYGDIITVTTADNNKHVRLTSNGETTEINQYISEDTEFFQLSRGTNTIGYSAFSGESNMEVSVSYTPTYEGV